MTADALDLEPRKRIFELIRRSPGLHYRELERQSELVSGTLEYHLQYLERAGLITTVAKDGFTRYFAAQAPLGSADKTALTFLRQELPRGLLLYLLQHPGTEHGALAEQFRVSRPTITYHMKRLTDSGVVTATRAGRNKQYTLANPERLIELLLIYRPSFVDVLVDSFLEFWYRTRN